MESTDKYFFVCKRRHLINSKEIIKLYEKLGYNSQITYSDFILTSPDYKDASLVSDFFDKLIKHFKKRANKCFFKIFICFGQDSEIKTFDNFKHEPIESILFNLEMFKGSMLPRVKGNPSFDIYVYFVEISPPPLDGGIPNDYYFLKAA